MKQGTLTCPEHLFPSPRHNALMLGGPHAMMYFVYMYVYLCLCMYMFIYVHVYMYLYV